MNENDIDHLLKVEREEQKQTLLAQTAKISWSELQTFFAAGKVIVVDADLDMIDIAIELINDNTEAFKTFVERGKVQAVPDTQAAVWHDDNRVLWAVVVAPWVLVQDKI